MRFATWNLHGCIGSDGRRDPVRIGEVLESLDADVIGLQEVDSRHSVEEHRDPLGYLASRLGMHAIAGPNLLGDEGEFGNAYLSRIPPIGHELLDLSVPGREPRGAIDARLAWSGRVVRVLVTHLGLGRAERATQIAALRNRIATDAASDAVVLIGDLNEWRPRLITRGGLHPRAFPVASTPRTFPSRYPILRLDRILATPAPTRFETRRVDTPLARSASDHLPVVADIDWA